MSSELMRFASGEVAPRREDKAVAKRAKDAYDEARLAGFKADAALALAGHIIEGATALDEKRQALSKGDPATNLMLFEIEKIALRQCANQQANLFNNWRF